MDDEAGLEFELNSLDKKCLNSKVQGNVEIQKFKENVFASILCLCLLNLIIP